MRLRRKRVGSVSVQTPKLHRKMIDVLHGDRSGNVTPLGTYKTNMGRTLRAPR